MWINLSPNLNPNLSLNLSPNLSPNLMSKKVKIDLFSTDHFSPLLCSECSVAYNAIVLLLMDLQCIEAMKLEFAAVTTLWLRMFLEMLLVSESSIAEVACYIHIELCSVVLLFVVSCWMLFLFVGCWLFVCCSLLFVVGECCFEFWLKVQFFFIIVE